MNQPIPDDDSDPYARFQAAVRRMDDARAVYRAAHGSTTAEQEAAFVAELALWRHAKDDFDVALALQRSATKAEGRRGSGERISAMGGLDELDSDRPK